ncbi:hypothetical protein ACF06X_23525 [Streptomyces sp. NPDC015346]|uniref:hypothetical protein n=1 Tax=Streptomyces sp. NPDC015346 TaxID=3364954 RepID=UPI0036FB3929
MPPADTLDPAFHPLACQSPEQLQDFLDNVKAATGQEVLGTLESLTMTVMTSIE